MSPKPTLPPLAWLLLFVTAWVSYTTHYNAREAHRHAHLIGCELKIAEMCRWTEENNHDFGK